MIVLAVAPLGERVLEFPGGSAEASGLVVEKSCRRVARAVSTLVGAFQFELFSVGIVDVA